MTCGQCEHAEEFSEAMTGPLARIQLAASELARSAATPRAAELIDRIGRAVNELDRIGQGFRRAVSLRLRPMESADLWPVLEELYERLAPAVTARGLDWCHPEPPEAPVVGDARRMRRAAVALLAAVSRDAAPDLSIRLALRGSERGEGLCVGLATSGEPLQRDRLEEAASEARRLALSWDGDLEVTCEAGSASLVMSWPAEHGR